MQILFFCPHWGSEQLPLSDFLARVAAAGYDGVEMNIPFDARFAAELKEGLLRHNLRLIAQQYLAPENETPAAYGRRMEQYLQHLASFRPLFINSHTGRDFYDFDTNCQLIEAAEKIAAEIGVPIVHETHRGRFAYSSQSTRPFLERYPQLQLTADFSHWVCVAESFLEDQPDIMELAQRKTAHLHARVGHPQGPQVTHPAAPEWQQALQQFLHWWDAIIAHNRKQGKPFFTISTEFGPVPYLPTLPFTQQPVASQWEVNVWMRDFLKKRYSQQ